jgi:hypothetical protein
MTPLSPTAKAGFAPTKGRECIYYGTMSIDVIYDLPATGTPAVTIIKGVQVEQFTGGYIQFFRLRI